MARVAPDEVLQHVYERAPVDWKLVVVDLRKGQPEAGWEEEWHKMCRNLRQKWR